MEVVAAQVSNSSKRFLIDLPCNQPLHHCIEIRVMTVMSSGVMIIIPDNILLFHTIMLNSNRNKSDLNKILVELYVLLLYFEGDIIVIQEVFGIVGYANKVMAEEADEHIFKNLKNSTVP